ncbi:hypothetical protein [Mucilaginibacter flavus]|uniref:hypothetical protein n=1 Tax=Mucilaginibacter flavus TaxID=931504 RepID=UPI0025B4BE99|nr:hypothetical protein [Mucilaginibacter flavus]MDN3580284.1 hypothetical protein [Mucilaginibacter flavus]
MKLTLAFILSVFINIGCFAAQKYLTSIDTTRRHTTRQIKRPAYLPQPKSLVEFDRLFKPWYSDCVFTSKYSITKRLRKYPFSKADKILAISYHVFEYPTAGKNDSLTTDSLSPKDKLLQGGFSIKADTLDHSTLMEWKTLNNNQIRRLATVLYNTGFKKPGYNLIGGASCYEPRNALIFVNKQGKVYDYLEVCFACKHYSSKSGRLNVGIECTQKYEILRKYFKSMGIDFGTRKNENRQ